MDVVWIPVSVIGWRLVKEEPPAKAKPKEKDKNSKGDGLAREEGVILATRQGGDEVLFASRDEVPLAWIKVGEFVIEPATIPEFEEEAPAAPAADGSSETEPTKPPFSVRRRGES